MVIGFAAVPFLAFPWQRISGYPLFQPLYVPFKRINLSPGDSFGMAILNVFQGEVEELPKAESDPEGDK